MSDGRDQPLLEAAAATTATTDGRYDDYGDVEGYGEDGSFDEDVSWSFDSQWTDRRTHQSSITSRELHCVRDSMCVMMMTRR